MLGIDRLIHRDVRSDLLSRLDASRIGMLTNDLALTSQLLRGRQALAANGWTFTRLFGPEHGLSGRAREGEIVESLVDPVTGVQVRSLYGADVRPSASDLDDLDVMLIDLPDVGARFYTYIWTMSHVLEACAEAGVCVVVLDRPNPIGGRLDLAEGPMLDERAQSLVGRWSMPIRHSLTIGEIARHWVRTRRIDVELEVIELDGWSRSAPAGSNDRTWMPPSPNLPTPATTLLYPGTCLAEGVNVSEGRSTAVPFRVIAAPFLDGELYAAAIAAADLPGIAAVPYGFTPLVRDFAGEACEGVILHVTDAQAFRPVHSGARLLSLIEEIHPGALEERSLVPMPGESDWSPIEKLFGVKGAFAQITGGEWNDPQRFEVPQWEEAVAEDLLYQ